MALSDRKIPIIAGRNDVPTTNEVEPTHPNGSYITAKFNELIDNELTTIETTLNSLDLRSTISVTGNGSYDPLTGIINISNAELGIDHINLTSTVGLTKTYTIYADSGETIIIGSFNVTNGENGLNGADGINGVDGTNGVDGQDGQGIHHVNFTYNGDGTHTLTIWGDLEETINLGSTVIYNGQDGQNGADGKGITNASYNSSTGVLTLNFSDSTTFETTDLRGQNGQGIDHIDASAGVNGQWITYTFWGDANETINLGSFTVNDYPSVVVLTQAQYDALGTYGAHTLYVING